MSLIKKPVIIMDNNNWKKTLTFFYPTRLKSCVYLFSACSSHSHVACEKIIWNFALKMSDCSEIEVPYIESLFKADEYLKPYEKEIRRRYVTKSFLHFHQVIESSLFGISLNWHRSKRTFSWNLFHTNFICTFDLRSRQFWKQYLV